MTKAVEEDFRNAIATARDGGRITEKQCRQVAMGAATGSLPDYQLAAWLMAVYIRGLSAEATYWLTLAMAESGGERAIHPGRVDKHSTGGVGDKTTLVVAPLVASVGVPVGKMSGRGLGHTGGTLDKLESIPGFRVEWTRQAFSDLVSRVGVAVVAQTEELAPADGRLYALRDATDTVASLPLIASSIMAKKIAGGAPALVLDVKVGRGAFISDVDSARQLARLMLQIAQRSGIKARALLTNMHQPLGYAVGNAIEVNEAVDTLRGRGPSDFRALSLEIAAAMLDVAGYPGDPMAAAEHALDSGQAWRKFLEWVNAQGGDAEMLAGGRHLPLAPAYAIVRAPIASTVAAIDPQMVAQAAQALGAGRRAQGDPINPAVGIRAAVKIGEAVEHGQVVFEIWAQDANDAARIQPHLQKAIQYGAAGRVWPIVLEKLTPAE